MIKLSDEVISKLENKDWLFEEYVNKKRSLTDIAIELGINLETVRKRLIKFGIPRRSVLGRKWSEEEHEKHKTSPHPTRGKFGLDNPNYGKKMSEDAKKRISESHKGDKNPFYGHTHSEEMKSKWSESRSGENNSRYGKRTSDEHKQKLSEKMKSNYKNPEYANRMKEISNAKETKQKMHDGLVNAYKIGRKTSPTHIRGIGSWYTRKDGSTVWLKSTYEVRVACVLDKLNVNWEYEPRIFDLGSTTYRPDFLINNTVWWEVKGWMYPTAVVKLSLLREQQKDLTFFVIKLNDIKKLERDASNNNVDFCKYGTSLEDLDLEICNEVL